MSAEVLREAAREIRVDVSATDRWAQDDPAFALAVADWLIQVATARESIDAIDKHKGEPLGQGSDMFLAQERHALAVARAYLGEPS